MLSKPFFVATKPITLESPKTEQEPIVKNNPYTINGWAFFDWANSAYALVITVAIFPGYFLQVTNPELTILGLKMSNSTLYAWSISLAYLIIALLSPILSGIADYGGKRKAFLRFFTLLGALACMSLLFFNAKTLWVGVTGFILATIGFAGGIVFYNSFLPIIATEDRYDDVSAKGFSYGFFGSVILLIINLIIIMNYTWFGFSEGLKAVPTAFVLVGLWWIGFSQIPLKRLPEDRPGKLNLNNQSLLSKGYKEVKKAASVIQKDSNTVWFLTAFFCYNSGVQAVLFLASTFAEKELHFNTQKLIFLVLILQIVAIGGAWSSAKLSGKKGNKYSLMLMLFIWTIVCVLGYNVKTGLDFYALAAAVGLVMGGTQALSRATYAKFLPENTQDTASYFSFYDVMDKVSTVMGTLIFGIVEQITGNMRYSILAMGILFVVSLLVMQWVKIKRMKTLSDN